MSEGSIFIYVSLVHYFYEKITNFLKPKFLIVFIQYLCEINKMIIKFLIIFYYFISFIVHFSPYLFSYCIQYMYLKNHYLRRYHFLSTKLYNIVPYMNSSYIREQGRLRLAPKIAISHWLSNLIFHYFDRKK